MIRFVRGNLFDSRADALVNTVNCVGVMGKGIAYQFRRAYPSMYQDYVKRCKNGAVRLGEVSTFRENERWIINFPTKGHWKAPSRIEDVRSGLVALRDFIQQEQIRSVALPPLGCGNGGLHWPDVRTIIEEELKPISSVEIEVYEPAGNFESEVANAPRLSLSHYVVTAIRLRLQSDKKLNIQKAAYFFNVYQREGYFRFNPHKYGPFCADLDRLMQTIKDALDHAGLTAEQLLEEGIQRRLSGTDVDRLRGMLPAIDKATNLCNAESGQVEALATAHAVIDEHGPVSERDLIQRFLDWSPEKSEKFSAPDVTRAVATLEHWNLVERSLLGYEVPVRMRSGVTPRRPPTAPPSSVSP